MAGSLPEGVYLFRNDASGLYMELVDADLGPNVPVIGAIANKLPSQQWELAAFEGDDVVFDLAGGDEGPEILLVPWTGEYTQRWVLEEV
jgi:hypothetical protein